MTARTLLSVVSSRSDKRGQRGQGVETVENNGKSVQVWADNADPLGNERPKATSTTAVPLPAISTLTIGKASEMYLDALKQRRDSSKISTSHYVSRHYNMKLLFCTLDQTRCCRLSVQKKLSMPY
jgi:hypothetical protein